MKLRLYYSRQNAVFTLATIKNRASTCPCIKERISLITSLYIMMGWSLVQFSKSILSFGAATWKTQVWSISWMLTGDAATWTVLAIQAWYIKWVWVQAHTGFRGLVSAQARFWDVHVVQMQLTTLILGERTHFKYMNKRQSTFCYYYHFPKVLSYLRLWNLNITNHSYKSATRVFKIRYTIFWVAGKTLNKLNLLNK